MYIPAVLSETTISLPFKLGNTGNISRTTDPAKIWADRVRSAIGTLKKERLFLPNYGSEVPGHTMDPIRSISDLISSDVASVFARHLSVLILIDTVTTVNSEEGTLEVAVTYELPTSETSTTSIGFATISSSGNITETAQ
jgi:hypothetical protein